MLYKPSVGIFKDNCVFFHEDRYYLFSMYSNIDGNHNDRQGYNYVWQAVSEDGVHWRDVGPVISAPFIIFAMGVWQVDETFYLNHGSFTAPGKQNVLRFWESTDLTQWSYMGEQADVYPDARWYDPESRLDCMDVICVEEEGRTQYYGIASGPGGWLRSDDGVHWQGYPAPIFEWGHFTPAGEYPFEIAGWQQIAGKLFVFGSRGFYAGNPGYCVYTHVGESPRGPFRPDYVAYRLSGNSDRSVHIWARPCRIHDDLLFSSYMYDGHGYQTGDVWLPPLKQAVVDKDGHLRKAYWQKNEAVKGRRLPIDLTQCRQIYPKGGAETTAKSDRGSDSGMTTSENCLMVKAGTEKNWPRYHEAPSVVVMLNEQLPVESGIVLEASVQITCELSDRTAASVGLFLEERSQEGTAIMLNSYGLTEIGHLKLNDGSTFNREDVTGPGCASIAGIAVDQTHRFRLLLRRNMFEVYLDDMYVQTFNTSRVPGSIGLTPQRVGFVVKNGQAVIEKVEAWQMSLD